jgi:hypothetical protein
VVKPDQFASVLRSGSASAAETGTIQKLLSSRSAVATENSENAEKSRVLGLTAVVSPACLSMCVHRRRSCPPIPWPGRSGIGEPCSPVETTDIASDATRSNLSNSATLSLREPGLLAAV